MRTIRLALVLSLCGIASLVPARADVSIHFLGFHYESHGSSSVSRSSSPSLNLVIETDQPSLAGRWTAEIPSSKPGKGDQVWCPITVTQGKSTMYFGTMAGRSGKYAFLFSDKKSWTGEAAIVEPAGSLMLAGKFSDKQLAGQFTFVPDSNYVAQASKQLQGQPTDLDLLSLALHEVSLEEITAYAKTGLKLSASEVVRLKNSAVTADYCAEVRQARDFSVNEIVRLRNSGVASDFPAKIQSAGYNFGADQLVRLRNSGVSSDFAREWKKAGFDYDAESLVRMRNSGVPSDFAKAMHEAFPKASGDEIARMRNSGITADFIVNMHKADGNLTTENLIRLRNSGVTPDYVKAWRDAGYSYTADELVRLRNAGVPSDYAAATNIPERKPLSAETLIRLRNRGLSAQEIRELRE